MDELMKALAQSIAHAGPEWAALIVVAVLVVTQVVPALKEYKTSRLDLERERQAAQVELERSREQRKVDDAKRLDQRDQERSRAEGRWLELADHQQKLQEQAGRLESAFMNEQTNLVIDGMRAQMEVNNALLAESKDRSRHMARQVDEMHGIIAHREVTD